MVFDGAKGPMIVNTIPIIIMTIPSAKVSATNGAAFPQAIDRNCNISPLHCRILLLTHLETTKIRTPDTISVMPQTVTSLLTDFFSTQFPAIIICFK
jgi:hypothetical protein